MQLDAVTNDHKWRATSRSWQNLLAARTEELKGAHADLIKDFPRLNEQVLYSTASRDEPCCCVAYGFRNDV